MRNARCCQHQPRVRFSARRTSLFVRKSALHPKKQACGVRGPLSWKQAALTVEEGLVSYALSQRENEPKGARLRQAYKDRGGGVTLCGGGGSGGMAEQSLPVLFFQFIIQKSPTWVSMTFPLFYFSSFFSTGPRRGSQRGVLRFWRLRYAIRLGAQLAQVLKNQW